MIVSTEQLISASEARKKLGQLLDKIAADKRNYFVILENGRLAGILIHPDVLKKESESFSDLEKIRSRWKRYADETSEALAVLEKTPKKDLPFFLK